MSKSTIQSMFSKIYRTTNTPLIPKEIDEELYLMIKKCFKIEPVKRIDIIELIERFNKIFLKRNIREIEITPNNRLGIPFYYS